MWGIAVVLTGIFQNLESCYSDGLKDSLGFKGDRGHSEAGVQKSECTLGLSALLAVWVDTCVRLLILLAQWLTLIETLSKGQ